MVLGQECARLPQRIHAHNRLLLPVEDEITRGGFLVGPDLQQDQMAQNRIGDLRIIHLLVPVLDRLGVKTFARGRVVLDLDGQVTAHALDEDPVGNRDVRMVPVAKRFAIRHQPAELVRRRKTDLPKFALAASVEIAQLPAIEPPLENRDVVHPGPDGKDHVEAALDQREFAEDRLLINIVEPLEVGEELLALQDRQVALLERADRFVPVVNGEDIAQFDLLLQPELHVETKQETPAPQLHHVLGHAVVGRDDAVGLEQLELDVAEDLLTPRIELRHPFPQRRALGLEPLADDLVGGVAEGRRGGGPGGRFRFRGGGSRSGFGLVRHCIK